MKMCGHTSDTVFLNTPYHALGCHEPLEAYLQPFYWHSIGLDMMRNVIRSDTLVAWGLSNHLKNGYLQIDPQIDSDVD